MTASAERQGTRNSRPWSAREEVKPRGCGLLGGSRAQLCQAVSLRIKPGEEGDLPGIVPSRESGLQDACSQLDDRGSKGDREEGAMGGGGW